MNQLAVIVATLHWNGWSRCVTSWAENSIGPYTRRVFAGKPILESYQQGFLESREPILGFLHDDLICMEKGWDTRVLAEFEDPSVGLVGFGGAKGHGDPEMYRKPYELCQIGRRDFISNMKSAEAHGRRFNGECGVAVLDGFALFTRRELLEKCGGWPLSTPVSYFCYDYWISCIARELDYRIQLVGVECDHLGGKSTGLNPNLVVDWEGSHRYIYDRFRNVLPCTVP